MVKNKRKDNFLYKFAVIGLLVILVVGVVTFSFLKYTSTRKQRLQCVENNHDETSEQNDIEDHKNKLHFLWFSDLHLDLYYKPTASPGWSTSFCRNSNESADYNAPFGRTGCDSPPELLRSALYAMKNVAGKSKKANFIVYTGNNISTVQSMSMISFT